MPGVLDGMLPLSDLGPTSQDLDYPKLDRNNEEASTEQPMLEQKTSDDVTEQQQKASDKKHHRRKLFSTACIYLSLGALGMVAGLLGPTFLDLQIITNTDTDMASVMFTCGSVGYLVGSIICGLIYERINTSLLLFFSLLGGAVVTVIVPFCPLLAVMSVLRTLQGVFGGAIETAGNADCVLIWGKDVGPYMQAIHFAYAFGGVIAPLIAEPFLTPREQNILNDSTTNKTSYKYNVTNDQEMVTGPHYLTDENTTIVLYDAIFNTTNDTQTFGNDRQTTRVHYAFIIVGIILLISAVPFIVRYFLNSKNQSDVMKTSPEDRLDNTMPFNKKFLAFLFLGMFFFSYTSVEDCIANFLMTFVVKHLDFTKTDGSLISALFWASFASFRFFGIFIARWVSPGKMLLFDFLFLILALLGLLFGSLTKTVVVVWISVAAIGAAESSMFPTMFTWTEKHIFPVTGKVSSFFLIMASAGTMIHPIAVGYLIENVSAMSFCYLLLTESVVCFLIYGGLYMVSQSLKAQRRELVVEIDANETDR